MTETPIRLTVEDAEKIESVKGDSCLSQLVEALKNVGKLRCENERLRKALSGLDKVGYLGASMCAGKAGNAALKAARDALHRNKESDNG